MIFCCREVAKFALGRPNTVGGHPSSYGYKHIAEVVANKLSKIKKEDINCCAWKFSTSNSENSRSCVK